MLLVLVVLIAAAIGGYYYYTHPSALASLTGAADGAGGASDAPAGATSGATAPTLPAPTQPRPSAAAEAAQLTACQSRGVQHGTCMLNPSTNEVQVKCDPGFYGASAGAGCALRCATGGVKATAYTPGFEGGVAGAATCACPSSYHFVNSDPRTGCELGDETGDGNCEAGFHGEHCDKSGEYKNCQNGTQDSTGACQCTGGHVGDLCQYPSDWCTKKDTGATFDATNNTCACSTGWEGARCTAMAPGYIEKDGKATKWTDLWTDMSDKQVTFQGGGKTKDWGKESCGSSNNCTQTVSLCSVLTQSKDGVKGCSSLETLCNSGVVGTSGDRCSLYEKGANEHGMGTPYFKSVTVPKSVVYGVWGGDKCGKGSSVNQAVSECMNETCTYTSSHYQHDKAFQFKLPPGHYAKCGATYYLGPGGGDVGAPPTGSSSEPSATFKST
ncbi:MAG: hypothetical protein CMN93_07735 [Synechococcus sp. CPC35]|nr:hypothetical protein [Synechococcus sp. CPC35]